jgi:serine O-acetyltransferase
MKTLFPNFRADLRRNLGDYAAAGKFRRALLALGLNSIHALALIRLHQWLAMRRLPTFLVGKVLFWFFKIEVAKTARIGPGLRLPHPMGIIIGPNTTIGESCDLYADVRLVLGHGCGQGPTIGNGVFLGDGAKVVGALKVGDNSVIGVSSVVTKDIPSNVTAVGVPARVLHQGRPKLSIAA